VAGCFRKLREMKQILVMLALAVGLVALGGGCASCSKKDAPPDDDDPPAASASAPDKDSVGIAACDAYLHKYETCLAHTGNLQAMKAQRDSFRIAAKTPEGRTGLKATCKKLLAQLSTNPSCAP
jgi:hypothetical protein